MSAQTELLKQKFDELKRTGLEDIKFIFGPLSERTRDDVCASINEALDAVTREDYEELPEPGDSRRPIE